MNVRSSIQCEDRQRIDPALVIGEWEVDGPAVDLVENTCALVLGVACADGHVENVEARRSPGEIGERSIALRASMTVTLHAPLLALPSLVWNRDVDSIDHPRRVAAQVAGERDASSVCAEDRVASPIGVPQIGRRCSRKLGGLFPEIVETERVVELMRDIANGLEFLAKLVRI